jgi:hypothetical protein
MNNYTTETQLLCTFIPADSLQESIENIKKSYILAFNNVYVLENVDDANQLILTYNIVVGSLKSPYAPPPSTISVHRKKQTNTIYTINALNALIASKNGGKIDKSYKIDWDELKNSILVTAHGQLKIVKTKIKEILSF